MQPGNYCRQMIIQFQDWIESGRFSSAQKVAMEYCNELAIGSKKFLLPEGGLLLEDPRYRALENDEELHLPFETIALEYSVSNQTAEEWQSRSSKRIIFAKHLQLDNSIGLTPVVWLDEKKLWWPEGIVEIPLTDFKGDGEFQVKGKFYPGINPEESGRKLANGAVALVGFLNALACSNVKVERVANSKKAKLKRAIPFDSYHVLTIETVNSQSKASCRSGDSHRSPREHIRRGHIRRIQDGRRIWVNAAVINAGSAGKVTKDYRVKP